LTTLAVTHRTDIFKAGLETKNEEFERTLALCSENNTFFNVSYLAPKVF